MWTSKTYRIPESQILLILGFLVSFIKSGFKFEINLEPIYIHKTIGFKHLISVLPIGADRKIGITPKRFLSLCIFF